MIVKRKTIWYAYATTKSCLSRLGLVSSSFLYT